MQFTFMNAAGTVLFVRDDLEQGGWTQEEYSIDLTFPFIAGKVILRGMRVGFRDPATDSLEVFEVRNVHNAEPDHYQQIKAEHIALSELSDEHINTTEITDKTAAQALTTALTGTLWSVGNSTVSGTQSVDISRGSVWQALLSVANNFNAYIVPRVTFSTAGAITGRYIDIVPAGGTYRGLLLSIDKNIVDSAVVYDDTEVLTALYGYGGSVDVPQTGGAQDKTEELTFKDEVWTATGGHPAKPANQTYLEWPEKTALYGRNGRPRYGYYQNSNIKDAAVLLEKTWEALQKTCDPKVTVSGTVTDIARLGYKGQPLRLHDTAYIEIRPTGEKLQLEIIKLYVDFIDPTQTRPEIGAYIPNIIYINRDTNNKARGGGGGGGRGQTNSEHEDGETYTKFEQNNEMLRMVVGVYNGGYEIEAGQIVLSINEQDLSTKILLDADAIDIGGVATAMRDYGLECTTLYCVDSINADMDITAGGTVTGLYGSFSGGLSVGSLDGGILDCYDIDAADVDCSSLHVSGYSDGSATWQTHTVRYVTLSSEVYYLYATSDSTTPTGASLGSIIKGHTDKVLHFLGSTATDPS